MRAALSALDNVPVPVVRLERIPHRAQAESAIDPAIISRCNEG